jgi:hypothetical protein
MQRWPGHAPTNRWQKISRHRVFPGRDFAVSMQALLSQLGCPALDFRRQLLAGEPQIGLLHVWRQGKGDSLLGTDLFRRGWKSYAESDALSGHRLAATASYPPARCIVPDLEIRYARREWHPT